MSTRHIILFIALLLSNTGILIAATPEIIPLPAPENADTMIDKGVMGKDGCLRISRVSRPELMIFPAENALDSHPAVIVCPGGGYQLLSINKEGTDVAAWFNKHGITAAVLKYTVPNNRQQALADAQAALSILQKKKTELKIGKIGMIGFSAGAHLTAKLAYSETPPDFIMLIYPAYIGNSNYEISKEFKAIRGVPPSFVSQSQNDNVYLPSALAWYQEMTRIAVPCEMHLWASGGHGYGLGNPQTQHGQWPVLAIQWLRQFFPKH